MATIQDIRNLQVQDVIYLDLNSDAWKNFVNEICGDEFLVNSNGFLSFRYELERWGGFYLKNNINDIFFQAVIIVFYEKEKYINFMLHWS